MYMHPPRMTSGVIGFADAVIINYVCMIEQPVSIMNVYTRVLGAQSSVVLPRGHTVNPDDIFSHSI